MTPSIDDPRVPWYARQKREASQARRAHLLAEVVAERYDVEQVQADRNRGCGSYAGWQRHKKRGEPGCDACREAKRAYERRRANARRRELGVPERKRDSDVDPAAVLRRADGDRLPLSAAEQVEVVRLMLERGLSMHQIEQRTGLNPRRVLRRAEAS